ncbi:hypothetical protein BDP81DRAFT_393925 [Colletotrichum phormii]|uniref:Uncharacterized protein n=1 Tax=Colletotrichum phormii TaxID=359342 RepID=A0AAI9ZV86_9PEZI|nr:uncharacterized protein BDP81DRAFT_393925 [Colletotrichum phormii]KAK1637247.1 hypothetical protein BDP81DRAFT_393925 [Colletotrichum phormii]
MSSPGILAQDSPNTQKRAGYIKTKFAGLIQDDSALPEILEKARRSVKEELINDKIDENGVSEYWHNWAIDFASIRASKRPSLGDTASLDSSPRTSPTSPLAPHSQPKKDLATRAIPSASKRMERGLQAIPEQPSLMRTSPNIATIELRQRMWDMAFPGEPCTKGRPVELGMPKSLDLENHVSADHANVMRWLPGCLRVDTVHGECQEGNMINAIVFSPKKYVTINVWSSLLLGMVYRTAANWAREVFMTCLTST